MEAVAVPTEPALQAARDLLPIPAATVSQAAATVAPPEIPAAPVASPQAVWVDWAAWLADHGQPPAKVVPGSQRAMWDGTAVYLGIGPRTQDGRVEVFHRDIEKNFAPLLGPDTAVPKTPRLVVIDPGHGGTNSGSRSLVGNAYEKELTLDWARRLKPLLEARGWEVRMTRSEDTSAELSERVAIAEQAGAALFVSLHFNSGFPNAQAAGLETYCLTPRGLPSNVTRDFPDDAAQTWPNNAFDAANLRLAFRVHRRLLAATGAADRGVKRARFMGVLRGQNRPAILVEGGYLSNPEEARKIGTPAYRQKLAEAVASALE